MGVYIEGLDRPRNEYMRIHIDIDGEVWIFRGSGWKSLGIKATNLDLVRCGECKYEYSCGHQIKRNGLTLKLTCCEYGKRRAKVKVDKGEFQSVEYTIGAKSDTVSFEGHMDSD